jgi:hypothetical protein
MILLGLADRRGCRIRNGLSMAGGRWRRQAKIVGVHMPERQDQLQNKREETGPRPPSPLGPDETHDPDHGRI